MTIECHWNNKQECVYSTFTPTGVTVDRRSETEAISDTKGITISVYIPIIPSNEATFLLKYVNISRAPTQSKMRNSNLLTLACYRIVQVEI